MSGAMSRRKGAVAERDVVSWLNANGFPTAERRGAGFESADIIGIPGYTIEVKNKARLELATYLNQLSDEMDADGNSQGVVIHKRKGRTDVGQWYATMPVEVWAELARAAGHGQPL